MIGLIRFSRLAEIIIYIAGFKGVHDNTLKIFLHFSLFTSYLVILLNVPIIEHKEMHNNNWYVEIYQYIYMYIYIYLYKQNKNNEKLFLLCQIYRPHAIAKYISKT